MRHFVDPRSNAQTADPVRSAPRSSLHYLKCAVVAGLAGSAYYFRSEITPIAIAAFGNLSALFTAAVPYVYRCDAFLASSVAASPYVQVGVITALTARYFYKKGYDSAIVLAPIAYAVNFYILPLITPMVMNKLTPLFNAVSPYVYKFTATLGSTLAAHPLITAGVVITVAALYLYTKNYRKLLTASLLGGATYSATSYVRPEVTSMVMSKLTALYHTTAPYAPYAYSVAITLISAAAATPYVTAVAIVSLAALKIYKTENFHDYQLFKFGYGERLFKKIPLENNKIVHKLYGKNTYYFYSNNQWKPCHKNGVLIDSSR